MPDVRVLVIADDPLARAGLAMLLAEQPGLAVAARVASDDVSAMLSVYRPDVLLWDLGWHAGPALERLAEGAAALPPVAVVLPDAASASEAWVAGARGLLRRDAEPPYFVAALAALASGLTVIDPEFGEALLSQAERAAPGPTETSGQPVEELTPRELAVLRLLADGLPNKTIAQRLVISEHTVKFHITAILGKLGVSSRTEAVVRATRLGLILL